MPTKEFLRQHWDRVAGWVSIALGAVALLLGWLGVSDTVFPAEQLPYILSGGVFGLFLCGVGATLLLTADLRDEWDKLDSIEDAIREHGTAYVVESANGAGRNAVTHVRQHQGSGEQDRPSPSPRRRRQPIRAEQT